MVIFTNNSAQPTSNYTKSNCQQSILGIVRRLKNTLIKICVLIIENKLRQ